MQGTIVLVSEFCIFLVLTTLLDNLKFNRKMRCEGPFHSKMALP